MTLKTPQSFTTQVDGRTIVVDVQNGLIHLMNERGGIDATTKTQVAAGSAQGDFFENDDDWMEGDDTRSWW